jgi:hypothetical protein
LAFGDVFAGYEGEAAKHWQNVLQMDYQNKRTIAEQYSKIADDPRYDEETQQEAQRRSLHTLTIGPGDKLPKEYENFTFTRKPPVPAPVQMPGGPQGQGAPIPSQLPGANAGPVPELGQVGPETSLQSLQGAPGPTSPTAGVSPQPQTVQPPTPPPYTANMAPMSFAEQKERQRQTSLASVGLIKESMWKPVAGGTFQQDDQTDGGLRHRMEQQVRLNPETGQQEFRLTNLGRVSNFAPRNGDYIPLGEAKKLKDSGMYPFMDASGKDLDLDRMIAVEGPEAMIHNMGRDQYEPGHPRMQFIRTNNQVEAVNPMVPTAPPTVMGTARPDTTREDWRPAGVDEHGRMLYQQFDSTTHVATGKFSSTPPSQPGLAPAPQAPPSGPVAAPSAPAPGVAPAPTAPPIAQNVPRGTMPASAPTAPPNGRPQRSGGLALGAQERGQQIMLAVAPAAQILYGDPKNPDFESLASFAKMADDPEAAARIGTAARFIIERLNRVNADGGPALANALIGSSLTKGIMNKTGLTEMLAGSEAESMQNAIAPLHDDEARYLARIMAAYGTVVGLRRFTGGGAYEFSTTAMERELPIPGLTGVKNSMTVYAKLAQLGEEISSATKRLDPALVPEQKFYEDNAKRLTWQSKGWGVAQGKDGSYMVQKSPGAPWEKP